MPVVIFYLNLGFNMEYFERHPYLNQSSALFAMPISFRTFSNIFMGNVKECP